VLAHFVSESVPLFGDDARFHKVRTDKAHDNHAPAAIEERNKQADQGCLPQRGQYSTYVDEVVNEALEPKKQYATKKRCPRNALE
jgi:hypothetical protein